MALSFALCASFAFAQTQNATVQKLNRNAAVSSQQVEKPVVGFNASIFTKADGDTLKVWDFAAGKTDYSTGVVSNGSSDSITFHLADGSTVKQPCHTLTSYYSQWHRLENPSDPALDNQANYPWWSTNNTAWRNANGFTRLEYYCDTARCHASTDNGFMFNSMMEFGNSETTPVNSYIDLGTVNTTGAAILDVRFFQLYNNYYDECYIDFNTDGSNNWYTMAINVDGVDVSINEQIWAWSTYTLPTMAANSANLHLRIRYYSFHRGSAHGYWWALDDVMLIEGAADRWKRWNAQYSEGAYQTMPQGLDLPLLWYAKVINNGVNAQQNVGSKIYSYDPLTDASNLIVSANHGNFAADPTTTHVNVIDPAGWVTDEDADSWGWYNDAAHRAGITGQGLPTANTGVNYVYSTISSTHFGEQSYDTIAYNVNADEDGNRIWGYDNGILTKRSFFGFGKTADGQYITDTGNFANAGYRATARYTTGAVVPENWVIRGIEMVVTTEEGKAEAHAIIAPVATQDEYTETGVSFNPLNTGAASTYEVKAADFAQNSAAFQNEDYLMPGEYTTIRIMFPEQPELQPYTSYRLGYQMVEAAQFATARTMNRYYTRTQDGSADSVVYFDNDPQMAKWASFFSTNQGLAAPQAYSALVYDGGWSWGQNMDGMPMIRAIVGPRQDLPTHNVNFTCTGNEDAGETLGSVTDVMEENDYCNGTATVTEHSYSTFYLIPSDGYIVDEAALAIDGTHVADGDNNDNYEVIHYLGTNDAGQDYNYWAIELKDVTTDHNITVAYKEGHEVGIDAVENVRMNLQPNPATSQVRLSLNGVTGMVNCALIDMSGRVVFSQEMNAENEQTIDLTNVAKGAYFVRINNAQFNKIEKLIVR